MTSNDKNDIRIEIARPVHRDGILRLAEKDFIRREPVSVAQKVTWDSSRAMWEKFVDDALMEPYSHLATSHSNEVIGFRLSRILDMDKYAPGDSIFDYVEPGVLRTILDHVSKDWAKFLVNDKGEKCKKVLHFLCLGVHADYGGKGLAEKMCRENLALAEELGCEYCVVIGSNWMSQRVFEKLGFDVIGSAEYTEFKHLVDVTDPKQKFSKAYVKKLRPVGGS